MPQHEIVVSTENNDYLVWQAMLFHASCVRHLGQVPIIMVHTDDQSLLPGFNRIREAGGRLQTAPDYRRIRGVNYPPRNTAATLRHVQTDAEYIVLCDPDMVFLQSLPWQDLKLTDHQVTFDYVGYLDPNIASYQPTVDDVCRRAGTDPARLRNPNVNGGVPHVIPTRHQRGLSDLWLEFIDLFPNSPPCSPDDPGARPRECHIGPQKDWLSTMWSLIMAADQLGLDAVLTRLCVSTGQGELPLPEVTPGGPCLIHYCYHSRGFNKHEFDTPDAADRDVWHVPPGDGSICGNVRQQLRDACEFYGLA
ncbi:MAG: hypothetical protein JSS49_08990 [Planctomycetes bacterium]|nr:hypothetical protein [Planctomycetota bacterium]